jgi:hypothetical protein
MGELINNIAGAVSGMAEGAAKFRAAQANQRMLEQEADALDKQAGMVLEKGDFDATQIRLQTVKLQGEQASSYAAQGVSTATGSAALVDAATLRLSEEDVKRIKLNAAMDAWGIRNKATATRFAADQPLRDARLFTLGKALHGGSSVAASIANRKGKENDSPTKGEK